MSDRMLYACPYPVSHQDIPEFASGVPGYGSEIILQTGVIFVRIMVTSKHCLRTEDL